MKTTPLHSGPGKGKGFRVTSPIDAMFKNQPKEVQDLYKAWKKDQRERDQATYRENLKKNNPLA